METHSANSVLDRLRTVISRDLGISEDEIKPETPLASLVTDSLELANLILEVEGEFGIEIEALPWGTVADAVKLIEAKK